jgi:hypothetical protein
MGVTLFVRGFKRRLEGRPPCSAGAPAGDDPDLLKEPTKGSLLKEVTVFASKVGSAFWRSPVFG